MCQSCANIQRKKGRGGEILPRVEGRINIFEAMEDYTKNATASGEQRINLKISLLGMDNTYLTIEGLSFKKRVIKTIAYYTELNKFKDIKLKAIERTKNKESKNEADSRTNFQPR